MSSRTSIIIDGARGIESTRARASCSLYSGGGVVDREEETGSHFRFDGHGYSKTSSGRSAGQAATDRTYQFLVKRFSAQPNTRVIYLNQTART